MQKETKEKIQNLKGKKKGKKMLTKKKQKKTKNKE